MQSPSSLPSPWPFRYSVSLYHGVMGAYYCVHMVVGCVTVGCTTQRCSPSLLRSLYPYPYPPLSLITLITVCSVLLLSRDLRLSIHYRDAVPQWSVPGRRLLWCGKPIPQVTEGTMDFICKQDSLMRPSEQYLPPSKIGFVPATKQIGRAHV